MEQQEEVDLALPRWSIPPVTTSAAWPQVSLPCGLSKRELVLSTSHQQGQTEHDATVLAFRHLLKTDLVHPGFPQWGDPVLSMY